MPVIGVLGLRRPSITSSLVTGTGFSFRLAYQSQPISGPRFENRWSALIPDITAGYDREQKSPLIQ